MRAHVKILFFCLLAVISLGTGGAEAHESAPAAVVADYSNITTSMDSDPHQSGYAVTLYQRADGLVFGDFTFATGATEAVAGRVFDLRFENAKIAFKAKTSAFEGPSKELFGFNGKVQGSALVGTLTQWDGNKLGKPVSGAARSRRSLNPPQNGKPT